MLNRWKTSISFAMQMNGKTEKSYIQSIMYEESNQNYKLTLLGLIW